MQSPESTALRTVHLAALLSIQAWMFTISGCGGASDKAATTSEIVALVESEKANPNLSASRNTPWELAHAALGIGMDATILDLDEKSKITLLDYFFDDSRQFGRPIFEISGDNLFVRPGSYKGEMEGHEYEFLAIFSQAGMALDTPIHVAGATLRLSDLMESAKRRYHPDPHQDVAFILTAAIIYLPLKETWVNENGRKMSIEKLVEFAATEQNDERGACGGTHRLFALALALRKYGTEVDSSRPPWKGATSILQTNLERLRSGQDPDGAIRPTVIHMAESDRWEDRIYSTGHSLEWALMYLNDDQLTSEWVTNAINYVAGTLKANSKSDSAYGARYHALHALRIYVQRTSKNQHNVKTAAGAAVENALTLARLKTNDG